jgi:hypothetical protein
MMSVEESAERSDGNGSAGTPLERVCAALEKHTGWPVLNQRRASCPACGDQEDQLTIAEGNDGRALLTCHHSRCSIWMITAAIGLTPADLFPKRHPP